MAVLRIESRAQCMWYKALCFQAIAPVLTLTSDPLAFTFQLLELKVCAMRLD